MHMMTRTASPPNPKDITLLIPRSIREPNRPDHSLFLRPSLLDEQPRGTPCLHPEPLPRTREAMSVRKKPRRTPYVKPTRKREKKPVVTPAQLCIVAILTTVLFAGGAIFLKVTSTSAFNISTHHDLQLFADFQKFHFNMNGICIGEQGESIRNDGLPSTIDMPNYTLSKGVSITIVAGSPEDPYNESNPFTLQAKHKGADTVYEYSFATDKIIER
ncbi:consensus disorder prediction [Desulfoluna spongiiphila]|nr:consensus disorder prediction [Desulfoluna spongiiphila]